MMMSEAAGEIFVLGAYACESPYLSSGTKAHV